jgi:hypothetical protein
MQLDICIPEVNLGFEYQGEQHYQYHYLYGSAEAQQLRDKEKIEAFRSAGITVIEIPFWWDGKQARYILNVMCYLRC